MRRSSWSELRTLTRSARSRAVKRCPRFGKVGFATEADARRALEDSAVEQAWGNRRRREKYVYPCLACGGWHLTSQEQA